MTDMDYRRQAVLSYLVALDDGEIGALLAEARGEPTNDPRELVVRELNKIPSTPLALNDTDGLTRQALGR